MTADHRLTTGAAALQRTAGEWLFGEGLAAALRRCTGATVATAFVGLTVYGTPVLAAPVLGGVLLAAWNAGIPENGEDQDEEEQEPEELGDEEFIAVLRTEIGDRNGVLLRDIADALETAGLAVGWTVAEVRQQCDACGIPVKDSIKVAGKTSIGVHRDALPPAAPAPSEGTQVVGSSTGQGPTTSPTAYLATSTFTADNGDLIILTPDDHNPARTHVQVIPAATDQTGAVR